MGDRDAAAALHAQLASQLAALQALQQGRVPPDSTLLAACGGKVPVRAAAELAEAAAAQRRQQATDTTPSAAAAAAAAGGSSPSQQQGAANAGTQQANGGVEPSESQRLQAAIRDKLRRLAPQKRRVQAEVALERTLERECSEFRLMDWRRMRRPLPGSNPRAFEPPSQPAALLAQQAALRAQRAAVAARADKLRQHRAFLEAQQREAQRGGGGGAAAEDQQQATAGGAPPCTAAEEPPAPVAPRPHAVNPFQRPGPPAALVAVQQPAAPALEPDDRQPQAGGALEATPHAQQVH